MFGLLSKLAPVVSVFDPEVGVGSIRVAWWNLQNLFDVVDRAGAVLLKVSRTGRSNGSAIARLKRSPTRPSAATAKQPS